MDMVIELLLMTGRSYQKPWWLFLKLGKSNTKPCQKKAFYNL
jgi:hypothetical protein